MAHQSDHQSLAGVTDREATAFLLKQVFGLSQGSRGEASAFIWPRNSGTFQCMHGVMFSRRTVYAYTPT